MSDTQDRSEEEVNKLKNKSNKININEDDLLWENFSNWIHCICVVTFDLELGQAIESIYPAHVTLSKQEIMNVCYLAFPDSNSGCMGDTTFVVRLQQTVGTKTKLRRQHRIYNEDCPYFLQVQEGFLWGYVYFRQVKDVTLPRSYFQKSVVILSYLPFHNLFSKVNELIAPEFFENGPESLEALCYCINKWPCPVTRQILNLPILGTEIQVSIPSQSLNDSIIQFSVAEVNIFQILLPVLSHIYLLWELVITAEPIVVMATSPTSCSEMVVALTRLMDPLKYSADYRPYFTIHDNEFKEFTSNSKGPPSVILGVTNPFFSKTLHHWPHTIRLGDNLANSHKYKLKKNSNGKLLETIPGLYTSYKPFLQKDKSVIKKLLVGIHSRRPTEAQTALLKKHLSELTNSFIYPLERYIIKLMPLGKDISPFKAPPQVLPFNPDEFLATVDATGPQLTSGVKGDWVGLYRRFFRSPNFNGWFNMRYKVIEEELEASHLKALANADFKNWVQGRPEVEVVDMILKIRNKLSELQEQDEQVGSEIVKQLEQRLQDILCSLPEDLKNIFKLT